MKLRRFEDGKQFDKEVKEYLLKQEALHNLQLGIIHTLIYHPKMYQSQVYLASVEVKKDIVAVAMRTPPYPLLLSKIKDKAALGIIAQDLYTCWRSLPGVNAPTPEAQEFARVWSDISGQSYKLKMALRVFQLQQVNFVSQAPGYLRLATETERKLLQSWYAAFYKEVDESIKLDAAKWVERGLQENSIYLWCDKVPVSMAACGQPTPYGVRISLVYTPPQYRKKGYASACVATLSQRLLYQGYKYCFLFTDLANPTSNHIYPAIGYQPVGDWNYYSFTEDRLGGANAN